MSTVTISEEEFYRLKEKAGEITNPDPAQCREKGHTWKFLGCTNAGCNRDCGCSVDVHQCIVCGDCDYGETDAADDVRKACEVEYGPWPEEETAG
ncbi:hypothetical protein [Rhizobium azibense]|uniref:Uncharacterized protein n=1 Tax=Rhizobium azibense TaxID=1136135 RepID=A0A4R3RGH8_9HYPH|nr:hypothetical protein [Rhizobium azibense]TCU34121.1 hypothetical protein EV129_113105 [Rhizobium azibense]